MSLRSVNMLMPKRMEQKHRRRYKDAPVFALYHRKKIKKSHNRNNSQCRYLLRNFSRESMPVLRSATSRGNAQNSAILKLPYGPVKKQQHSSHLQAVKKKHSKQLHKVVKKEYRSVRKQSLLKGVTKEYTPVRPRKEVVVVNGREKLPIFVQWKVPLKLRRKAFIIEEPQRLVKACQDCKTTITPLWRGGPGGPKSLCNACGIRFRKRRSFFAGNDIAEALRSRRRKLDADTASSPHTEASNEFEAENTSNPETEESKEFIADKPSTLDVEESSEFIADKPSTPVAVESSGFKAAEKSSTPDTDESNEFEAAENSFTPDTQESNEFETAEISSTPDTEESKEFKIAEKSSTPDSDATDENESSSASSVSNSEAGEGILIDGELFEKFQQQIAEIRTQANLGEMFAEHEGAAVMLVAMSLGLDV